jgi:hypothetical protein
MAVRTPLKLDGSNNLIEMSTADIDNIKSQIMHLYGTSPSVTLSQVAIDGSLDAITDTRLQAGAMLTHAVSYRPETTTAEPSTVTVTYDRIDEAAADTTASTDTNSVAFPIFNNGGNIQAMTLTDMYDTFINPTIDLLVDGTDRPGTYRIHTATTLTDHTIVSTTPVYSDTRADTTLYTASGMSASKDLDQPTTITNFYLFKTNSGDAIGYPRPLYIRNADADLQEYTTAQSDAILLNCIRHTASEITGNKIRYRMNGAGNARGSGMTNTILNGAGNYQTRFVNANDYRSQEFPNGTAVTAATHYLRIYKA